MLTEIGRLIVRFRRAELTPQVCHQFESQLLAQLRELAWIPMQKKKPNNSPDFLPYFRYNRLSTVVFWVYQYTMFHAVRSPIQLR